MKALSELPSFAARDLKGILFDLDDTVLTHGRLTASAYEALFRIREAGLRAVVVTGRPSGWGHVLALQWPVDGVICENGALAWMVNKGKLERWDLASPEERRLRRDRLVELGNQIHTRLPDLKLSGDCSLRETDCTWDIGEYEQVPEPRILELQALIRAGGARTTRSSVHVHATFDACDKSSGVLSFLRDIFEADGVPVPRDYAFIGDSGNDAACFASFPLSLGVANVMPYLPQLPVPPAFIASKQMGEGFVEIVDSLLRTR